MFGFGKKNNKKQTEYVRRAHHAGSWYEDSHQALNTTLSTYLADAEKEEEPQEYDSHHSSQNQQPLRAIVSPHAGFAYSGPTAAYAYRALAEALASSSSQIQHIVVLHPSHHVYLDGCAVSGATLLETPIGSLQVDAELREELLQLHNNNSHKEHFTIMEQETDEQEHSGEMQYPYIAKALLDGAAQLEKNVKVLPIMVGAIDTTKEQYYGKLLGPILARPNVVTIVSSDFCHWGSRFQYQPFRSCSDNIFSQIENMDRTGMSHIEMQDPGAFAVYLKQTSNTICGRHAIAVWLNAVQANREAQREVLDVKFVRYAQSSQVKCKSDSSVSYASAVARTAAVVTNGDASTASLPN